MLMDAEDKHPVSSPYKAAVQAYRPEFKSPAAGKGQAWPRLSITSEL